MNRQADLEKIYKSTLKFLNPLNAQETYKVVVEEAMHLVSGEIGTILLESNGTLSRVYASDPSLYSITPRPDGFMYTAYKTNKSKRLTVKQIASIHPEIKQTVARSDIIVPLSYKNKAIGVISVMSSNDRHFTARDLKVLEMYAPLATLAIRKTQLYDETSQALATRDLFISMASHELRTPLTTVYAFLQLMKLKVSEGERLEEQWIDTVVHETERLRNLVNELLQVDRIKEGKLKYEWRNCNILDIVNRAVNNFVANFPGRDVIVNDLSNTNPILIYADFDKLIQVLINLLTNAAKFSDKKSRIEIRIAIEEEDLLIDITDYGNGIPEKDLSKIFNGFYRGSNNQHEGMGLGLYLTKSIIDEHNGNIAIKTKVSKGTTVFLRLPITINES